MIVSISPITQEQDDVIQSYMQSGRIAKMIFHEAVTALYAEAQALRRELTIQQEALASAKKTIKILESQAASMKKDLRKLQGKAQKQAPKVSEYAGPDEKPLPRDISPDSDAFSSDLDAFQDSNGDIT